jgi:hypothetical protein
VNLHLLTPLVSCVALAGMAAAILARDSGTRTNRLAAGMCLAGAYWGACELLWTATSDPEVAFMLVRLSAPGWMLLGPCPCICCWH